MQESITMGSGYAYFNDSKINGSGKMNQGKQADGRKSYTGRKPLDKPWTVIMNTSFFRKTTDARIGDLRLISARKDCREFVAL